MDSKHMFFSEFQRKREAADVKQHELAAQLGVDKSTVSRIESGDRMPGRDLVEQAEKILGVTDGILCRLLDDLKRQRAVPERFRPWLEVERQASKIRMVQLVLVPGLLQTEEYARAVCYGDADRVAARMERQVALGTLKECVAVVDQGILTRPVAEPPVMAEQLTRLAEDDRVRVHVVPTTGYHLTLQGAFTLATLTNGTEVALLDNPLGGVVMESPDEIDQLRHAYEEVLSDALPRVQSRQALVEAAERWKAQAVSS